MSVINRKIGSNKRVVIVDDNCKYRYALKYLLQTIEGIEVVGEASNGFEFLKSVNTLNPDLAFIDIEMPILNGIQVSKSLLKRYPDIKIIILTTNGDEKYYPEFLNLGIKDFVSKDSDIKEFELAIKNQLKEIETDFTQTFINEKKQDPDLEKALNKNELEILDFIAKGLTNEEISKRMHKSKSTIKRYRANMLKKTKTNNPVNLILFAVRHKLIDISKLD